MVRVWETWDRFEKGQHDSLLGFADSILLYGKMLSF